MNNGRCQDGWIDESWSTVGGSRIQAGRDCPSCRPAKPKEADRDHTADIQAVADVLFRGAPVTDDVRDAWSSICVDLCLGDRS